MDAVKRMIRYATESRRDSRVSDEFFDNENIVRLWNYALKQNADQMLNYSRIADLLPFVVETGARISKPQFKPNGQPYSNETAGVSIISLTGIYGTKEETLVRYGLEPLLGSGILMAKEAELIVDWYSKVSFIGATNNVNGFDKEVELNGITYRLFTDCTPSGSRNFNLAVVEKQEKSAAAKAFSEKLRSGTA